MGGAEARLTDAEKQLRDFLRAWHEQNGRPKQSRVAALARLSPGYVSEVLSGRKSPSPKAAADLIEAIRSSERHRRRAMALAEAVEDERRPSRRTAVPGRIMRVAQLSDSDAFELGVHRSVKVEGNAYLPDLTPFIARPHDRELRRVLRGCRDGSHLVLLRGATATGKTRSCLEAMRAVLGDRVVWHARELGDPDELLAAFDRNVFSDQMVVWLDDVAPLLRGYPGRQVAKEIREVLTGRLGRSVLLLGSIWSGDWSAIFEMSPGAFGLRRDLNQEGFARAVAHLLDGKQAGPRYTWPVIVDDVPLDFSSGQARAIDDDPGADPRLKLARADGNWSVTQYLAGAPQLEEAYQTCAADAREVLDVFMDFGRLSNASLLPVAFLAGLRRRHGDRPRQEWRAPRRSLPRIIAALQAGKGDLPGPITHRSGNLVERAAPKDEFLLARHLGRLGRSRRRHIYPGPEFWETALTLFRGDEVLNSLARAAEDRQRYSAAAALYSAGPASSPTRYRSLATVYAQCGDYDRAVDAARKATEGGDTTPLRVFAGSNLPGYSAEHLYSLAASAGDGHAAFLLTRIYLSQGRGEDARAVAEEALRRGQDSAMRQLVISAARRSDFQDAEELFRRRPHAVDLLARDTIPDEAARKLAEVAATATGTALPYWALAFRGRRLDGSSLKGRRDARREASCYRAAAECGDPQALGPLADALLATGHTAEAVAVAASAFHAGERFFGFRLLAALPRADLGSTCPAGPVASSLASSYSLAAQAEVMEKVFYGTAGEGMRGLLGKQGDVIIRLRVSGQLAERGRHDEAKLVRRSESRMSAATAARVVAWSAEHDGRQRDAFAAAVRSGWRGHADALADLAALRLERGDQAGAQAAANAAAAAGHCGLLHALAKVSENSAQAERHLRRAVQAGDPWATVALWRLTGLPARLSSGAKRLLIAGLAAGDPEPLLAAATMFSEHDRSSAAYELLTEAAAHDDSRVAAALAVAEYHRGQPEAAERQAAAFLKRRDTRPMRELIGAAMDQHDEDLARQMSASLGEYLTTAELLQEIRMLAMDDDMRRAVPVLEIASARGDASSYLDLARAAVQAGDQQTAARLAVYAINCGERLSVNPRDFIPEDHIAAHLGEETH